MLETSLLMMKMKFSYNTLLDLIVLEIGMWVVIDL